MHGGNELETSDCNERYNEPCTNEIQHRDICWCNNGRGSIFSAATVLAYHLSAAYVVVCVVLAFRPCKHCCLLSAQFSPKLLSPPKHQLGVVLNLSAAHSAQKSAE
jgi:hypothetical protein